MSTDFTLQATGREETGKGASRRLRRLAGEVPAIVYGGKKNPAQIKLVHFIHILLVLKLTANQKM